MTAFDSFDCTPLVSKLANLQSRLSQLQQILSEAGPFSAVQAGIQGLIEGTEASIRFTESELVKCRSARVAIECTQAIQYFFATGQGSGYAPDNTVPLISERSLVLRVYVDSGPVQPIPISFPPPTLISGRVTVDRIGADGSFTPIGVLTPINGPIAAKPAGAIDRLRANDTLNFRVPSIDCQGELRLTVQVYEQWPFSTYSDAGQEGFASVSEQQAPWTQQVYVRFTPVPAFRIQGILIHYTAGNSDLPAPTVFDFINDLGFMLSTYPIGRLDLLPSIEMDFATDLTTDDGQSCGPGWSVLLQRLQMMRDCSHDNAIYVALVPSNVGGNTAGCGSFGGGVAAAKAGAGAPTRGWVLAQEVGHAFGRMHAPPRAPSPDPSYPHYDDYPKGSIGEYGFDITLSQIDSINLTKPPDVFLDFMGYPFFLPTMWVSPYTYMGLRNAMVSIFNESASARFGAPGREMLFLQFTVYRDGRVVLGSAYHLSAPSDRVDSSTFGNVSLELLDHAGEVLYIHRCRRRREDDEVYNLSLWFHEAVPWINGVTAIRFLRDGKELYTHDIGDVAPDVTNLTIHIGSDEPTIQLQWSARSRDNVPIRHMVRYSNDAGRTWHVVAVDLTNTSYQIDHRQLSGGDQCLFQVLAASNVHTSSVISEQFQLPIKPRKAAIFSPDTMSEFVEGEPVVFRGGGLSSDFDFGEPEEAVWRSDLDGILGRGFDVEVHNLSVGTHMITLALPNGIGEKAQSTVMTRIIRDRGPVVTWPRSRRLRPPHRPDPP